MILPFLVIFYFFGPAAFGFQATVLLGDSNVETQQDPISAGRAKSNLSASPTSVSFGNVVVGTSNTQVVTLTNTGRSSVSISQAAVAGAGFRISGLTLPLTLGPAQSSAFNVIFAPTATGSVTGNISLSSNAANSPTAVALSGTGVIAVLSTAPTSVNFGNVVVGTSSLQSVMLTDTGTANVSVSQATVTGAGFSISGLTLPLTLTPGQSSAFNVIFAPTTAGSLTGGVTLVSDASNSPTSEPLAGSGVKAHRVTLSWTASTSTNVVGYKVYRGAMSGGPYTMLNASLVASTSFVDSTVQSGQSYYYVTTAIDNGKNESVYSNEAQAIVPFP